jgi:hypothetical protein
MDTRTTQMSACLDIGNDLVLQVILHGNFYLSRNIEKPEGTVNLIHFISP